MTENEILKSALAHFAQLPEDVFDLSDGCWKIKEYKKGDIYNPIGSIYRYLGFTLEGYFRAFLINEKGEEVNMFLFPARATRCYL